MNKIVMLYFSKIITISIVIIPIFSCSSNKDGIDISGPANGNFRNSKRIFVEFSGTIALNEAMFRLFQEKFSQDLQHCGVASGFFLRPDPRDLGYYGRENALNDEISKAAIFVPDLVLEIQETKSSKVTGSYADVFNSVDVNLSVFIKNSSKATWSGGIVLSGHRTNMQEQFEENVPNAIFARMKSLGFVSKNCS